jgi:hypothetical protein
MGLRPANQANAGWATSLGVVGSLTALAILPVFFVEIPAMVDYPNHLARMYLLAATGSPNENPYYTVMWKLCPNLAMDIIVPAMARFTNIATATKAFLVFSQVLVVSGAVVLEMAVKRRHEFAGFAAALALYCVPFAWGFLNFEFGTGLALWGIASWIALENRSLYVRLGVHSLFVFCIFVSHLVAFALYGTIIGLYELYRIHIRKFDAKQTSLIIALLAGPAAVLLGYVFLLGGAQAWNGNTEWDIANKARSITEVFNGYSIGISAFNFIVVFMLAYVLFRSRSLKFMPQGKWIAVGFLVAFLAVPFQALGGTFSEVRVVIAAILIIPAFLLFTPTSQAISFLPPLALSVIALLNAGHAATIWIAYQPEYDRLKASFQLIERGAFVLVGQSSKESDLLDDLTEKPMYHAPVLAAYYAKAFVPSLYTIPGQYVFQVRPEFKRLNIAAAIFYEPVPILVLKQILDNRVGAGLPSHVRCWMDDYDYLYLVGPQGPNPIPSRLAALAAGERFALYRIIKPPGEGNGTAGACPPRSPLR